MSTLIGLYYPYIHFKDDNWIKLAVLYWDKMARIVPEGMATQDSDTVRALADESLIESFAPDRLDTEAVGRTFCRLIDDHGAMLQTRYSVASATLASREGDAVAYVSDEKISYELRDLLRRKGLASTQDIRDYKWVGMHPKLAAVYMTALAENMSARRQLHPVADETLGHLAMSGLAMERLTQILLDDVRLAEEKPSPSEVEENMATVALRAVLPKNLDSVPVNKIIAFRKKYPAPLAAFQSYVRELVAENGPLQEIRNAKALRLHLEVEYEKKVGPQLEELRKQLKSLQIETVSGAFNIKAAIPRLVESGGAALGLAINPILGAAGGFALALIPVIREKQEHAQELKKSTPSSYLLNVQEELNPRDLTSRISTAVRHFVLAE